MSIKTSKRIRAAITRAAYARCFVIGWMLSRERGRPRRSPPSTADATADPAVSGNDMFGSVTKIIPPTIAKLANHALGDDSRAPARQHNARLLDVNMATVRTAMTCSH